MKTVTITNAVVRQNKNGESFTSLILSGGVEMIKSSNGSFYASTKKCSVPSTLDPETAKMMIGQQLDGEIIKVDCEPYSFTNADGKEVELSWRYEFQQDQETIPDEAYEH